MSKRLELKHRKFHDLEVIGDPVTHDWKLYWPCRCLRPIHAGQADVIRHVRSGELSRGDAKACLDCTHEDARKSAVEGRQAQPEPTRAKVKGCAELLCNPPFHSALCPGVNLSPQTKYTERKDPGTGIYSHA